ncbi:MAG: GNAT family N-acetyltransferase [Eubacteriales bacterium]|nr:GNAT family N-acetyltransferase [Eubacteriales bacterium]
MELHFQNHISVAHYNRLRLAVGWNAIEETQAATGLRNTLFLTVACDGTLPVGMARLVGDGGYAALICDVIVHPDYQGQHIGTQMMTQVMAHIRGSLAPGQAVMINLMAAKDREGFYESFGFAARPNDRQGAGMCQWMRAEP